MRRAAGPRWWTGLALLGFVVVAGLAHLAISGYWSGPLQLGAATATGVPHAAANGLLLWWFGRTLRKGREPLVTRVARRVHGTLSAPIVSYTRKVTIAWCGFFAAQIAVSGALFLLASLDVWSLFVNVLNLPLVILMFGGEYLVRVISHPEHPRASISATLRAFTRSDPVSTDAKAC